MGNTPEPTGHAGQAQLGLWDAVSIILGIVIGTSIFTIPPTVYSNVPGPWAALGVWLLCGGLSVIGAFCYAELGTAYPRSGGDYVYISRAFGAPLGFLFGWAQLAVILSGSTGMMAFIFGEYGADLIGVSAEAKTSFAAWTGAGAVLVLTLLNVIGVVFGKVVQNALVATKILGLGAIIAVGLFWGQPSQWASTIPVADNTPGFGLAMILVLYAYGGWNDAAFVAADVRNKRDLPRALILGTVLITLVYLAINAAYILGLGFEEARQFRPTIASDLLRSAWGDTGGKVMSLLVMISALGAMNALIFTGSRVFTALGSEHSVFSLLGRWHPRLKTPIWALAIQSVVAIAMILLVGIEAGRSAIDNVLTAVAGVQVPWGQYFGGFNTLFAGTAPVFWTFFLLTGLSFFVLRVKEPHVTRPFKLPIPVFPLFPFIFCGMCVFGLYSALTYANWLSLMGVIPLAVGIPLYFVSQQRTTSPDSEL